MYNFDCLNGLDGDILKGINLREKKIKLRPITCDITEADFSEPSSSDTNRWHNLERSHARNFSREYEFSSNIKGTEGICEKHNTRDHNGVRKTRKKKPHRRAKTRCPMRIMELSVPTKRHCLETWRSNRNILPNFMVERLRRIVMDEKPIVKIYDAINCFKRQKSTNSRMSSRRQVQTKHQDQIKLLLGLLSYKVIQKLQRPLNLTLGSHLKILSQVVNEDITSILYDKKKSGLNKNIKIQNEIADTVTIWITSILEESAHKILMEEFQELKEVEGPVWDLIDQLIDNVAVLCEPVAIVSSSVSQLSILSVPKSIMNENQNLVIDAPSISNHNESSTNSMDYQQVQKSDSIIAYILDNIAYNKEAQSTAEDIANSNEEEGILDTNNNRNENNDEHITASNVSLNENNSAHHRFNKGDVDIVQESTSNEIDSHINNANNIDNERTNSDDSNITKLDITTTDDDEVLKIIKTSTEIEHNINVNSTDNNILSNGSQEVETTPDDSIKKVKFSNLNIGANNRKTGVSDDSHVYIREGIYNMPINLSDDGTLKHELHLAPPNENLLSDADESWPENLHFPVLKATVSVSKSILSLGNILENEEKELTTDDRSTISNNDRKVSPTQTIQAGKNEEIEEDKKKIVISTNEKYPRENYTNTKNKYYEQNNCIDVIHKQIQTDDSFKKEITAVKLIIEHMPIITIQPEEYNNYNIHEIAVQTEQEVLNNVVEQILSAVDIFTSCKIKEDSKEICRCRTFVKGYHIKEFEVRKWCHGLENVMENLELWIDWVDITCNYIMSLKHTAKKRRGDKYAWAKLVINIDLDSKTWVKIGKRLRRGITSYKSYYVNSKVSFFYL